MDSALPSIIKNALAGESFWLVGGALRDYLLGRSTEDIDLIVTENPRKVARTLASQIEGAPFQLSEQFGAWRVVHPKAKWHIDITPLQGETILDDLALRDFTVNAMAQSFPAEELIDPYSGYNDVQERNLRMVSEQAFSADPLRVMRLVRIMSELGFSVDAKTLDTASAHADKLNEVAGERIFLELKRIIVSAKVVEGIIVLEQIGALRALLPEVSSSNYMLEVLRQFLAIEDNFDQILSHSVNAKLMQILDTPLSDELTTGQALRLAAFFSLQDSGLNSAAVRSALQRLRTSERLQRFIAATVQHYLAVNKLIENLDTSKRSLYRFLDQSDPVGVEVTVLALARSRADNRQIDMEAYRSILESAIAWQTEGRPKQLIPGDELAKKLGKPPGPWLGEVLHRLEEEQYVGSVHTADEAIAKAQELVEMRS